MDKIVVNLGDEETLKTTVKDLNYIPEYKQYELERQRNEEIRKSNEVDRVDYYENLKIRVDNGEFNGKTGPKGDTGNSGVYIGTEKPTDPNVNVWIDSDGEAETDYVKTTDYANQTTGGVAKMWTSTNEDGEIGLNISTEV